MDEMQDDEVAAFVATLVDQAEAFRDDEQQPRRLKAIDFYNGVISDLPAEEGRSKATSRDVRDVMKKLLPSVMRAIFGSDNPVEYQPGGKGDEEGSAQSTDYVNRIVVPETDLKNQVESAIRDAMLMRNGILKVWVEEEEDTVVEEHTGLDAQSAEELAGDDSVEVIEAYEEDGVHSLRIRVQKTGKCICVSAIPPEEFLKHPKGKTIADSPLVAHSCLKSRSDLIEMGYDKGRIDDLSAATVDFSDEDDARRDQAFLDDLEGALEELDYYECFVRVDADGDGVAEFRRIVMIGGMAEDNMFENDIWDEAPFFDMRIERESHRWEGRSIFDDVEELQRIKTVLMRETLDNIYWQNSMQPVVNREAVEDLEPVFNPGFGKPIVLKAGYKANEAITFATVPFVADSAFQMISYIDDTIVDRTGISDASGGLDPNALQNVTAKASAMFESAGIAQAEMIVETIADHLIPFFRQILKLTVQHQDRPRTMRLRGKWVQVDPRSWNADMDAVVNTGLGTGSPERQAAKMQVILGYQEKLLASMGADNVFVKPDNIYASLKGITEAAGIKTPSLYFTEPDPAEVKAKLDEAKNQPNPEMIKAEATMKLEQAKMQMQMQFKQLDIQANRDKEQAQMQADLTVRKAEMEKDQVARSEELRSKALLEEQKIELEREKMTQDRELKVLEINQRDREAEAKREADIQRAQAAEFAKQVAAQTGGAYAS